MTDTITLTPRLFLSRDEWERLPEKLQDPIFARLHAHNLEAISHLDAMQGTAIHDVSGAPTASESHHRMRGPRPLKARLLRGVAAWYMTKDPAYYDLLLETIDEICRDEYWQLHPKHKALTGLVHADLQIGEMLYTAAFALDTLSPYLDADRRDGLISCIRDRGLRAYLDGLAAKEWWRHAEFNWCSAVHGNAGLAALVIQPLEPDLAATVIREAVAGLQYLIDAFPAEGGWIEGMMYQITAIAHLTDFVAPFYRLTGNDLGLLTNRRFQDAFTYRLYMVGGDGRPMNFSNCPERTREWSFAHAYWWAGQWNRPELAWFEDQHVRNWRDSRGLFHDVEAFWYRAAFQPAHPAHCDRLKHFSGLDWVTWHGEQSWLAFRGGFNGGNHNNLDLGQIILGYGEERFLVDPGYGAIKTAQHNVPTVRHTDQADGAVGDIFRLREFPGGFYLACDLSAAYPHTVAYCYRHLLLIDDAHLLVLDDIFARKGRRNSARYHLQTRMPVRQEERQLLLQGQQQAMTVRFLVDIHDLRLTDWEQHREPVTTITWSDQWDHVHSIHPILCSFAPAEVESRIEVDRFILRLNGKVFTIDLAEGTLERDGR